MICTNSGHSLFLTFPTSEAEVRVKSKAKKTKPASPGETEAILKFLRNKAVEILKKAPENDMYTIGIYGHSNSLKNLELKYSHFIGGS